MSKVPVHGICIHCKLSFQCQVLLRGSILALRRHKDTKSQYYIVWIKLAGIETKDYIQ